MTCSSDRNWLTPSSYHGELTAMTHMQCESKCAHVGCQKHRWSHDSATSSCTSTAVEVVAHWPVLLQQFCMTSITDRASEQRLTTWPLEVLCQCACGCSTHSHPTLVLDQARGPSVVEEIQSDPSPFAGWINCPGASHTSILGIANLLQRHHAGKGGGS